MFLLLGTPLHTVQTRSWTASGRNPAFHQFCTVDDTLWINALKHLSSLSPQAAGREEQGGHQTHIPSISPGAGQQPQVIESAFLHQSHVPDSWLPACKRDFLSSGQPITTGLSWACTETLSAQLFPLEQYRKLSTARVTPNKINT